MVATAVAAQQAWAKRKGLNLTPNGSRLVALGDALLAGDLHPATRNELAAGAGKEINRLASLRSSTCLAVNVFEPWRTRPEPIAEAFGATQGPATLQFESKQPTGLGGISPHLDVLVTTPDRTLGIECKFLEMYSPATSAFRPSYFEPGVWEGLPALGDLASRIQRNEESFRWLGAAQLLKHALGLYRNHPRASLMLVWYRADHPVADEIEAEIGRFQLAVTPDLDFRVMTYQELVHRLRVKEDEPTPGYFDYLLDRYKLGANFEKALPLIEMGSDPRLNHRDSLDATIRSMNGGDIAKAYYRTVTNAPRRNRYLVGHDGGGGIARPGDEKTTAKALFNHSVPLRIGSEEVQIIDYEVPLRGVRTDRSVGEIDLLGLDITGRLWVIELKVHPSKETPLKALLQALRYSAMLEANRMTISEEVRARPSDRTVTWPFVIAVAADAHYWRDLVTNPAIGDWLPELERLADLLTERIGADVALVDLGPLGVEVRDEKAHLRENPQPRVLFRSCQSDRFAQEERPDRPITR